MAALALPMALALGATLGGCGASGPQSLGATPEGRIPSFGGALDLRPADSAIPDRPHFEPRRLLGAVSPVLADGPPTLTLEIGADAGAGSGGERGLAYTSSDIRWIEVAVHAQNAWVYDDVLSARTRFRALNVPTGYAWVFLAAYDAYGYNIVNNADGYVYSLVSVRNGTISSLKLNLPLL